MANVLILIAAQQQGFLLAVAKLLSKDHRVAIATSKGTRDKIEKSWPELAALVDVRSDFAPDISGDGLIEQCLAREERYGETFSMISSYDRALGKGYLFNADRHPDIIRSWWPHKAKLTAMLRDFIFYEHIIARHSPDLILSLFSDKMINLVARHHNVPCLALAIARFGSRYIWVENEHLQSSRLTDALQRNLTACSGTDDFLAVDYEQVEFSRVTHSRMNYSYRAAVKDSLRQVARASYLRTRGAAAAVYRRKRGAARVGYRFLGWVPCLLRRPNIYRYFLKHGKKPQDLDEYRIVYVPLHLEPEIALLAVSPEFNNSMEMIAWISKSVPADTIVVVKEQPFSYGIRSKHYYDNLRRIGNVVLANPDVHSWDWIRAACVVATISGTAGIESVYFQKPVLSFGKHQVINHLPIVRFANSYESTRQHIKELMELDPGSKVFEISREALYRAQMETSFELAGFEHTYRSREPQLELARIAVDRLYNEYRHLFKRGTRQAAESVR